MRKSIVTNYGYDTFGALSFKESKYGATTLYRVDYVRDSLSRIIEKTEIDQSNTITYDYTYDVVGRLSQVRRNDTLMSVYSYDANGNRLAHWTPAQVDSGCYDSQDRLINYSSTQDSTIHYFYTQNGDLTQTVRGTDTTRYSYDAFGSLRSVMLPEGTLIDYLIDGSGKRIGRKVNGAITQKWLYSSDLRIIAEFDSANNIISRFVYTTSENVPEYFEKSDTIYRIITDHLGSVRQVVNTATGTIIQKIDYDEYGNVFFDSRPGFTPFGYAGGLYDEYTKLVRFGARDYEAEIGRWTKKDPIRFAGGNNYYAYLTADIINQKDPRGEDLALAVSASSNAEYAAQGYQLMAAWAEIAFDLMATVMLANQISLLMAKNTYRPHELPDNIDDDITPPGGTQKMPGGDNKHWNKFFEYAAKICGLEKGTDAYRRLHEYISKKGYETAEQIIRAAKELGVYKGK